MKAEYFYYILPYYIAFVVFLNEVYLQKKSILMPGDGGTHL